MKRDITSKKDINFIVTKFYDKLLGDENMLPFFIDIVKENQLNQHIEVITNFWNDILFDTISYQNNVMQKHLDKNAFVKFRKEHFSVWVSYFSDTIDNFYIGENAINMKSRAASIATVMQLKMNVYKK